MDEEPTAARALRHALADKLVRNRIILTAPVEDAMRSVPRHLFVPDAPLDEAYGNDAIVTRRDPHGAAVSSASAPSVVAAMLEQLDVRPGHRVLEIGAGTGYNAVLLSRLTGPSGQVTTVDIIGDVARTARERIVAADAENVSVIHGDGEFGHVDHAPYDRIIVTAGAWDVPPAWSDQLASGGLLLVPLRMLGVTRSVALARENGHWRSRSMLQCGFVPMHGAGAMAQREIRVGGNTGLLFRIDDGRPADPREHALDHPAAVSWTGVTSPDRHFEHLDFWLASLDGFCRVVVMDPAAGRFVPPLYSWGSMGVIDGDGFAYLTKRACDGTTELGVCAYGPRGEQTAELVADRIRAWDRKRATMTDLWIEVHPAGRPTQSDAALVVDKRHTRVVVRTAE
ncbi:hypothetical protein Pth03_42670 [Planotetraspora thailandica]|uniref:Protein-L-isoaspartate O-methyltransferase n=1 Tax=Planotetraspora thailandica TaxID=487172 RepID=A0A8J3XZ21_9ACTN|nr:methyltransferase, FxLD system [Planotetraspora thailandica]GII55878.1 hypothetical protein Pth03_42670 [Planotetraspora thailandica]